MQRLGERMVVRDQHHNCIIHRHLYGRFQQSRRETRIVREARREQSINREFSDAIFHAATTGALVIAGVAVWVSLAGSGVDLSGLPLAPISLAAATAWLACLWSGNGTLVHR